MDKTYLLNSIYTLRKLLQRLGTKAYTDYLQIEELICLIKAFITSSQE